MVTILYHFLELPPLSVYNYILLTEKVFKQILITYIKKKSREPRGSLLFNEQYADGVWAAVAGDDTAGPGDDNLLGISVLAQFLLEEGAIITDGVGDEDPLWRDVILFCQRSVQQALEGFGPGAPEFLGRNHAAVNYLYRGPDF